MPGEQPAVARALRTVGDGIQPVHTRGSVRRAPAQDLRFRAGDDRLVPEVCAVAGFAWWPVAAAAASLGSR